MRIVLEGVDKFSNLIGSVYYPDGESAKELALELVETVCHLNAHYKNSIKLVYAMHKNKVFTLLCSIIFLSSFVC